MDSGRPEKPGDGVGAHGRHESVADAGVTLETRRNADLLQRLREARAPLEPGRPADRVPRTRDVGRVRIGAAHAYEDPNVPQSRDLERPLMVPKREVTDAKRVWLGARGHRVCPR